MADPRDFEFLRWSLSDGVLLLTLDRPEVLNALDTALKGELLAALQLAAEQLEVRAVVLTGAGKGFCAGQDLSDVGEPGETDFERVVRDQYIPIVLALRSIEKPVIAAINGAVAGAGLSFALACDIRLASESAVFVAAFGTIALVPDSGMSWLLPRIVGPGRAAEILMAGRRVDAAEAERFGLVNRVVAADALLPEALSLAGRLAKASPLALALTKRALNVALESDLREQLDLEAQCMGIASRSADHAEGLAAFREKRPPRFEGR